MPTRQTMRHCRTCARQTLHVVDTPNHILHLLLTVLTAGIWGIVWLWLIITQPAQRPRCTACGSAKVF